MIGNIDNNIIHVNATTNQSQIDHSIGKWTGY